MRINKILPVIGILSVLATSVSMARGGSFGGGRSSSGGGFSRSSGGSIGFSRSNTTTTMSRGSLGTRQYNPMSSPRREGSFGPSRSLGGVSRTRTSPYLNRRPLSTGNYRYNGRSYPANRYGGFSNYSFYHGSPMWYYRTPFHPAFYFSPPVYHGGAMYPGGVNWLSLFFGLVFWIFVIGLVVWLVRRNNR